MPSAALRNRVAEWDPGDDTRPVPPVDRATLAAFEAMLEPAPRAVVVAEVAATMAVYEPPKGNVQAHANACVEALLGLPLDILRDALREMRMTRVYPTAPMPGELRRAAAEAMSERVKSVAKARVASTRYRPPTPPRPEPTEAEIAEVSRMVASVHVQNRDNPLKSAGPERAQSDEAKILRTVAVEAKAFRLPDESDPAVQRWMGVS